MQKDELANLRRRLEESEQRYQALVQAGARELPALSELFAGFPEGVILVDASGQVTFCNDAARQLYGSPSPNPTAIVTPEYQVLGIDGQPASPEDLPVMRALLLGQTSINATWRIRRSGGLDVVVQGTVAPRFGPDGSRAGALLLLRDITIQNEVERQRDLALGDAEVERDRLQQILDVIPAGISVIDAAGNIFLRNRAATALECQGQYEAADRIEDIDYLWTADGARCSLEEVPPTRSLRHGEVVQSREFRIGRTVEESIPVLVDSAPLQDSRGQVSGAVVAVQPIEELKRAELELRQSNQAKEEFLAMLAHEMRNPLAPILNAIHVLEASGTHDPAVSRAREIIERQARHLSRMLDDLRDVSRLNRGKIELRLQPVEIRPVVEAAVEACRALITSQNHQFDLFLPAEPVWVEGDPTRLEQILDNLLNNAAKYTEPGGKISLAMQVSQESVELRVQDTGVGIPPAMLPSIFNLFMQVDHSLHRSQGGLGIGLTLVKNLVEMHGGSVSAHSEGPGEGSRFIVRLPRTPAPAVPDAPTLADAAPFRRRKVLLIEDNPDSRETMRDLVQLWGHEIVLAVDGPEGLEMAAADPPEIVLIDIGLPAMDGYAVAEELRQRLSGVPMKLVAITGHGQPGDRDRAAAAGFDAHLVKPVDPEDLARILSEE